jgi:glutaconate CoA-transferase, subunit A
VPKPRFVTVAELADYVHDGERLGVGGLHFVRLPMAALHALIEAGRRDLHFISWGGGLGLELMLAAQAVRRISFCFCSLDVFGLAPLFRQALEEQTVEVDEWPALAMIQGFHAAQQGLPSMPFQLPVGSDIMARGDFGVVAQDPISGAAVGAARPLPMDVFILHAQRADEDGNVELQGARGLDLSMAWASKRILVTVEEIVPRGTLVHGASGAAIIPHNFVTAIAHAPGGAYPASCLPYYVTDYRALLAATQHVPARVPPLTGERAAYLRQVAQVTPRQFDAPILLRHTRNRRDTAPAGEDEIMAVTLARMYDNDSLCAVGAVSPLAMVSYLLAKHTHAPDMIIMPMSSGFVGIGPRPMTLLTGETLDAQTSFLHCGGDDTYHQYYQRGLISHEVVSAAQIDQYGRTNNIAIRVSENKVVRLPGQGGMADVANMHQNFLLYLTRHSPRTLLAAVDHISAARGLVNEAARRAAGYRPGYVRLVTNLGVFDLNPATGLLELTAVHPGVTVEQVAAATGFPLRLTPEVTTTPPPTAAELDVLRHQVDPLGLRRLEFIPGKERTALLTELLDAEEAALNELFTGCAVPATPGRDSVPAATAQQSAATAGASRSTGP